ncbi:hypothetical protein D3C81_1724840 [compost metagenome]
MNKAIRRQDLFRYVLDLAARLRIARHVELQRSSALNGQVDESLCNPFVTEHASIVQTVTKRDQFRQVRRITAYKAVTCSRLVQLLAASCIDSKDTERWFSLGASFVTRTCDHDVISSRLDVSQQVNALRAYLSAQNVKNVLHLCNDGNSPYINHCSPLTNPADLNGPMS